MAAYYDYIPGAVQWRTPALDPSNECGTFLSYKITDWCNKVGPNYAQIWTNHEDWEASDRYVNGSMTSTDNAYIQFRLLGRDHRAGTLTGTGSDAWRGFSLNRRSSNNMLEPQLIQKPSRADQSGGYERSNLLRDTYGHIYGYTPNTLSNNYNMFRNSDFVTPKITRVLYSDTPGSRYFAWQINGRDDAYMTGVIYEVQPRDNYPPGMDIGWAMTGYNGYSWLNLPTYDPDNRGNYRNYFDGTGTRVSDTYTPGYQLNSVYARPVVGSIALRDYHGDVAGTSDNFFYGNSVFERNFTYRIGGKKYFAWSDYFLLPID